MTNISLCLYSLDLQVIVPLAFISPLLLLWLQPRVIDDVKRKFAIFEKSWSDGKLSEGVQLQMSKLSIGEIISRIAVAKIFDNDEEGHTMIKGGDGGGRGEP